MSRDHDQLSALVDGELDHETRDQLLAHLAHCAACREVVDAERAVKSMLAGLAPPEPSAGMLTRAGAIGAQALAGAGARGSGGSAGGWNAFPSPRFSGFAVHRSRRTPGDAGHSGMAPAAPAPLAAAGGGASALAPTNDRRTSRFRYGVAGALGAAGVCFAMAFVAVSDVEPVPEMTVVPPASGGTSADQASTVEVPVSDPTSLTSSFVRTSLPDAMTVPGW